MKRSHLLQPNTLLFLCIALCFGFQLSAPSSAAADAAPAPLLTKGHPVEWWFVFKLNAATFPACGGPRRQCLFGGSAQPYRSFGQQYVYASSESQSLTKGSDCAGDTTTDPVGATFDEVYNGSFFYVVWNDQFYNDPPIRGCSKNCGAPWGHSKGMLAWNSAGEGLVLLQVTTPSWPAAGSRESPRATDGNTLGCVKDDNVEVSQHFFALRLTHDDLVKVLSALANSSVVTDPTDAQIVKNGGPPDVQDLVESLGKKSASKTYTKATLSGGVMLLSKPSGLHVPPWQMVSALLGGVDMRTATWWASPKIYSTTEDTAIGCWDSTLRRPGAVEIATTGQWAEKEIGLTGGPSPNSNHAKIGISTSGNDPYVVFGDLNQQGTLSPGLRPCTSSQNGRGGVFYVLRDKTLSEEVAHLMTGHTAPTAPPSH